MARLTLFAWVRWPPRPAEIYAAARPLKVVWELLDFDTLVKCQAFDDLLGGAVLV
jgi:hypothetical protein